ncbi:hypothetical protein [Streptomyces ipomoeae]|uniref:hypothetical protein n=1 Tax=Streptomyces ipomoeae TaxID=103232 RepID=UPI001146D9BE|nr:hypothetical protein [Streptomyces ipomoeae]MDX2879384.1 hypothetical protein [Streptomyces ipomoeae]TQE19723.1 hypothetical protein Sipo7851_43385 [Streptomyces ipomoeae]
MTHLSLSFGAAPDLSVLLAVGIPVAALALVLTGWAILRRGAGPQVKRSGSAAVAVAALAALGCTVYSADTSWRFAADYLDIAGTAERAGMFAAAELALFATALMARQNLATQGAPGMPGTLVWVITGVQVIPAYAESGLVGGTVRAFVGPVLAAVLWHLAMGIELRQRTPGAASRGLIATLGREARERLLSRLGIATRDRDAAQITRDRATARAVTLAARLAERTPKQQQGRRGRRLTRRLSKAIGRASVGTDPAQRAQLLGQLAARRHALALATMPLPSPWSPHSNGEGLVPEPIGGTAELEAAVPSDGPRPHANPTGDRTAQERGPVPGTDPAPGGSTVPKSGDRETGTASTQVGTEAPELGTDRSLDSGKGTAQQVHEVPAQATGDRGPSGAESGTDPTGDQGPADTDTGTDPTRDQGHMVPLRRKPSGKAKGKRGSRSRSPKAPRPSRELQASVDQLVQQVLPHVPALLQRDGNETVTRVQLREIIRREGLTGGRNDRLSLVLQQLRSEATTTTARSATR